MRLLSLFGFRKHPMGAPPRRNPKCQLRRRRSSPLYREKFLTVPGFDRWNFDYHKDDGTFRLTYNSKLVGISFEVTRVPMVGRPASVARS